MTDSNHPPIPTPTPHRRTVSAMPFSNDAPLQVYLRQLMFEHRSFATPTSSSTTSTTSTSTNPVVNPFDTLCLEVRRRHFESFEIKRLLLEFLQQYQFKLGLNRVYRLNQQQHVSSGNGGGGGGGGASPSSSFTLKHAQHLYVGSGAGQYVMRVLEGMMLRASSSSSRTDVSLPPPLKQHTSFDSFVHDLFPHMRLWEMTRARCIDVFYQLVRSSEIVAKIVLPELTYAERSGDMDQQQHSTTTTTTTIDIAVESTGSIPTNPDPNPTTTHTPATFSCSSLPSCLILQILLDPSKQTSSSRSASSSASSSSSPSKYNNNDESSSSLDASIDAFLHNLYSSDRLDPASMLILWRLSPWSIHVHSDTDASNDVHDAEFTFDKFRTWLLQQFGEYFFSPEGVERLLIHTTLLASFPSNTSSRRIVSSPGIVERMLEILPPDTHKRIPRLLEWMTSLSHRTFISVDTFLNVMRSRRHAFEHERQSLMALLRTIPGVNNDDDEGGVSHEKVFEGLLNLFPNSIRRGTLSRYRNADRERMRLSSPLRLCIDDMRRSVGDVSPHASFASSQTRLHHPSYLSSVSYPLLRPSSAS